MKVPSHILPVIVVSQFCCTSLWFAGNGVLNDLVLNFSLSDNAIGHLTSAVQLGFIVGTLTFAIFTIADRISPSRVFLSCALLGGLANLGMSLDFNTLATLVGWRFTTGFFLAGIYPVGMKIAADYFDKGLGKSLGYLVGALVVGTALPHLLVGLESQWPWKSVLICVSLIATAGGLMMYFLVSDGPYRKQGSGFNFSAFFKVFGNQHFRSAAFGYFGHMWELYAFWAFVPVILMNYQESHAIQELNISWLSFAIIATGGLGCVFGGYISQKRGAKPVAFYALLLSGLCCLISPFMLQLPSITGVVVFLLFWGVVVVADSPQFSTLVAQNADPEIKGTALTIVNCIGFAITIVSIQLLTYFNSETESLAMYSILALGPVLGLITLGIPKSKRT